MKAELAAVSDIGRDLDVEESTKADIAYALYDGGDVKSKSNQMVKRIALNGDLSEEDRARMLKAHEDALMAVDNQLADDKRRQEQELDRALKERLERRKQAKKKLNKEDLNAEVGDATAEVNEAFSDKKASLVD